MPMISRRRLGELSLADGPAHPNYKAGFDHMFVGIGQAEIGEYVACAVLLFEASLFFGILRLASQLFQSLPNNVYLQLHGVRDSRPWTSSWKAWIN